jgi:hypothetical protein
LAQAHQKMRKIKWSLAWCGPLVLTINLSSTTNRMLRIPASSEAFEHNLWVLNSFNQPPAVSESTNSGDRRYSIDAATVALSWANNLISDLQIHDISN